LVILISNFNSFSFELHKHLRRIP